MKKLNYVIGAVLALVILGSCEQKREVLTFKSADEKVTLTFTASQSVSLDPWALDINVKGYGYDETVSTELYVDEVDDKTIIVNWSNNNNAIIMMKQNDGDNKTMSLTISEGQIQLL